MIENTEELKKALGVETLRELSGEKVLALTKKLQNGELGEAAQRALLNAFPALFSDAAKVMDAPLSEAVGSNDRSSSGVFEAVEHSKAIYEKILQDSEASEERKKMAIEGLANLDKQVFEHDVNNKKFNLEALRFKQTTVVTIVTGAAIVAATLMPEGRKWLLANARALALPGN